MYLDYCKIGKKSLLLPKVYNIYISIVRIQINLPVLDPITSFPINFDQRVAYLCSFIKGLY